MTRDECRARCIIAWRWFLWRCSLDGTAMEAWGTAVALARYEREAGVLAEG